jgi:hypothetical protein
MEKENEFLLRNPIVVNIDTMEKANGIIKCIFDRYYHALKDMVPDKKEDITDWFSCMILGPRVVIPGTGIEPYVDSKDMVMFMFALYTYLNKSNSKIGEIYNVIKNISDSIDDTTGLYDSLINAIDTYKITDNNISVMLDVLSKVGPSTLSHVSMGIFIELVDISSMGVLLSHNISKRHRSEIVYAEIIKGLNSNLKVRGIPSEEIIDFFINAKDSLIIKTFDVSMLAINLYIMLYTVKNLHDYIEIQTKNIDYKYMYKEKDENESEEELKKKAYDRVHDTLTEHYANIEKILKRLLLLSDAEGNPAIDAHTCGYILVHVPPTSYIAYSAYETLYKDYVTRKVNKNYNDVVKAIVYLCPNIDIDLTLYIALGIEIADIITGIRIGFLRYALYTIKEIENLIQGKYGVSYKNDEEENEKIKEATRFLRMGYIEKIQYLTEEIPEKVAMKDKECKEINGVEKEAEPPCKSCDYDISGLCSLEETPEFTIANSSIYKENNLALVLRNTNAYVEKLLSLTESIKRSFLHLYCFTP